MKRTTTEAELRQLVGEGLNFPQIAERLGVSLGMLRTTASVLGISTGHKGGRAPLFPAEAYMASFCSGKTVAEVALEFGVSSPCVHNSLKRAGYPSTAAALVRWLHEHKAIV